MIDTLIIWTPKVPEYEDVNATCPYCGSSWLPYSDGDEGECPDCEYKGKLEEWYK